MRALLQRVKKASVTVEGKVIGSVGEGYLILLGVREGDTIAEAKFLAQKTAELRVFTDPDGKMNLSMMDVGGGARVVSQFTLYADCKKGRRPSFVDAMKPPMAEKLYLDYVRFLKEAGVSHVEIGEFGADMLVSIDNDGPVTIMLDTDEIMKKG